MSGACGKIDGNSEEEGGRGALRDGTGTLLLDVLQQGVEESTNLKRAYQYVGVEELMGSRKYALGQSKDECKLVPLEPPG